MKGTQESLRVSHTLRKPRLPCICCHQVGPIVGRGLRGVCYARESAEGTLSRWPKTPRNGKRAVTPSAAAAAPPPAEEATGAQGPERLPETLTLTFDPRDLPLYDRLEQEARAARRTTEQQALHLLETHLSQE